MVNEVTSVAPEKVGLIGLGLLGTALAERFLRLGKQLIGFDLDVSRRDHLMSLGGIALDTARDVVGRCRRIVLSLPTSDVVARVLDDIEPVLTAGKIIIDTTTGDPDEISTFGPRLEEKGVSYLDATVGGSSQQVRAGEAIVMVGGPEQSYSDCEDLLSSFTKDRFHVGPCGSGARMKLVMNLVLGLNRAVLGEALAFASSSGVEPVKALDILKSSPAYSRVMDVKGGKMLRQDFTPQARLSQHLKDVRLILRMGARTGARLPLSKLHEDLLAELEARGLGDADNSAVIKAFL
jgi:3-hydroxyisobutyrate dehydrogenase-like beta-hydroxyacid dehydrogenase